MPRNFHKPRRPRLRKKTREESNRFWQEYAQKFQDANNSITSGRSSLPTPTLLGGSGESNGGTWSNGTPKRERTIFRLPQDADSGESGDDAAAYAAREKAAVEEARKKARQIAPLYNKGAYQLITEGDREALFNDGRGKK